jgi:hypothetical protein
MDVPSVLECLELAEAAVELRIRDLGRVESLPRNRLMDRDVLAEAIERTTGRDRC